MKTAVIGLGSMGMGAALSLVRAGHETRGFDVLGEAVERFAGQGGLGASSVAEAVEGAEVIFVFLVSAAQTRSVLFGSRDGAVSAARLGAVFVLNATMPPDDAASLAADLKAAGMAVLDAPVSGWAQVSAAGELTLIVAGAEDSVDRALPALEAVSKHIHRIGAEPGAASRIKMIDQLLAGVHIAAMAEALVLAAREGIDLRQLYDVISHSAGSSRMFENRAPQVIEGDETPYSVVDIFVKDLGIVEGVAGEMSLPLARDALSLFREAAEGGMGRRPDVSVVRILAARAGVELPAGD